VPTDTCFGTKVLSSGSFNILSLKFHDVKRGRIMPQVCVGPTNLVVGKLPKNGTLVPQHVRVGTWYCVLWSVVLYFNQCILLLFKYMECKQNILIIQWCISVCTYCTHTHTHTHTHIYIYTHTHICIYTYINKMEPAYNGTAGERNIFRCRKVTSNRGTWSLNSWERTFFPLRRGFSYVWVPFQTGFTMCTSPGFISGKM